MESSSQASTWVGLFEELRLFVRSHEGIVMDAKSLSVPAYLREDFYRLVECAQTALMQEVLGSERKKVSNAAQHCSEMRSRLVDFSNLKGFHLADMLENLLLDVDKTLSKPAFGLILDALQEDSSVSDVRERAQRKLIPFAALLFRNAYEAWAYYGIVAALEPVEFYQVISPDTEKVYVEKADEIWVATQITSPERRMPEAVFKTKDGRIFAMKSEAARELDYYGTKIERRRDSSAGGNTAGLMGHRVLMLYQLASIDAVSVVVDRQKHLQVPSDLLCEVLEPCDMSYPAYVSTFVERINAARSRRAVQVITFDEDGEFPEGLLSDETVAPIERYVIGFDERKFLSITKKLCA